MNATDRTTAQALITAISSTGIKAPAVTQSWAATQRLREGARTLSSAERDSLGVAVVAAIDSGTDPAADEAVQRILAAGQLDNPGVAAMVDGIAFDRFRTVCTEHADQLITSWTKPFDAAAQTLDAAHQRIGDVPLEDSATILAQGGDIAQTWADAQGAVRVVDSILAGWAALAELTRAIPVDRRYQLLRVAALDYPTWAHIGAKATPWEAVLAGLTLTLPTFGQYRERVAAIEAGRQRAAHDARPIDRQRSAIAGREIRVGG